MNHFQFSSPSDVKTSSVNLTSNCVWDKDWVMARGTVVGQAISVHRAIVECHIYGFCKFIVMLLFCQVKNSYYLLKA